MKVHQFLLGVAVLASSASLFAQVRPGTIQCLAGSKANPAPYCTDATPCKDVTGGVACLAGTPNPPAGAVILTSTCWAMGYDYTCLQYQDTCTTYTSDANCTEIGTRQCTKDADGAPMLASLSRMGECSSYTRNFSCKVPKEDETITQTTSCDLTSVQAGLTWNTTSESAAADFIQAATSQEFARQLVTYGTSDGDGVGNLFPGVAYKCTEGYFGLKSCCKTSGGGGASNSSLMQKAGATVAMAGFQKAAGYAIAKGSHYAFDTILTKAPEMMSAGLGSTLQSGISNTIGQGFGAYGFGTSASAAGGMFGASSSVAIGQTGLYFNPYALAAAIAIQLIMEAMQCSDEEYALGNARGLNLCVKVGAYCSSKGPFGCLENTQSFCCFNGLLGKGLQVSARQQLGIGWGSPKAPDCRGLSASEIMSIDFNHPSMEAALAPFKDQIMSGYNKNAGSAIESGSVQSSMTSNTTLKSQSLCLQRQKLDPSTVCE